MGTAKMTPQANIAFWFELLRRMTNTTYVDQNRDPRVDKDLQPTLATLSHQKGTGHLGNLGLTNWESYRYEC